MTGIMGKLLRGTINYRCEHEKTVQHLPVTDSSGVIVEPALPSVAPSCHSKNPKMVKVHEELEYRDCFDCHLNRKGLLRSRKS